MKRKEIGMLAVIFGGLCLSIELYCLKIIQKLDMISGSWFTNAFRYANEPVIAISLFIVFVIILFGLILILYNE